LVELSPEDIQEYLRKIFRVLTDNRLQAVANIELTLGDDGQPNNTVHFHILTDDQRTEAELRKLLEVACERQGLMKDRDFCITHRELWDGYRYFNYFTKYGKKYFNKVILFQPKLLQSGRTLQKFYTIGQWFTKDRGKIKIWDEIKAYMQEKYGTDIEKTGNSDDIETPDDDAVLSVALPDDIPTDELSIEQDITPDKKTLTDHFVPIDKRCFIPDIDCIHSERTPDQQKDWQRFRYRVSFLQ
jgi:hypothetical protein